MNLKWWCQLLYTLFLILTAYETPPDEAWHEHGQVLPPRGVAWHGHGKAASQQTNENFNRYNLNNASAQARMRFWPTRPLLMGFGHKTC